jgi:hypothetical protein
MTLNPAGPHLIGSSRGHARTTRGRVTASSTALSLASKKTAAISAEGAYAYRWGVGGGILPSATRAAVFDLAACDQVLCASSLLASMLTAPIASLARPICDRQLSAAEALIDPPVVLQPNAMPLTGTYSGDPPAELTA